ncbi:MAG: uracil-DNA glycosylase [Planctomycetia bacterium]|nr:uracil-DNA glycosylase [Planctomycetia bacterium]
MSARDARALKQRLDSLAAAGVTQLPKASRRGSQTAATPASERQPEPVAADPGGGTDRIRSLRILNQQVADCTQCVELAATRTNTVFGVGPPDARICFFGEAPGADEDASGEPFVGRAGQLLTKIIEACKLRREEVYILNVLKCRPPGNRPPLPGEVANCRRFFERQLEIIGPQYICCLGTSASHALLETTEPIGKLRKRWFTHGAAKVICTYHPSYLLRNPAAKRDVWDDMKVMMTDMGVEL